MMVKITVDKHVYEVFTCGHMCMITCSWLCLYNSQIVLSSVEKREILHNIGKQQHYTTRYYTQQSEPL